jgi:hypothetical protein
MNDGEAALWTYRGGKSLRPPHTHRYCPFALPHKRIAMLETNVEEYFFQFCLESFDDPSTPFFFLPKKCRNPIQASAHHQTLLHGK